MLASALAVLLGLGSFVFYMAAFVYPEVHRRLDLLWSGLGLLYASVLWFDAAQMTGLVLLGQVLAVVLLLGLGWQTLTVRRQKTPLYQQTPIVLTPEVLGGWAKSKLNDLRIAPDESVRSVRLERRVAEDPTLLSSRLDPRRRPAYDYEFVEDGVADIQQGELFAEFSKKGFLAEKAGSTEAGEMTVPAYAAPPSAEAEVVTVDRSPSLESADEDSEVEEIPVAATLRESEAVETVPVEAVEDVDAEDDSIDAQMSQSETAEVLEDNQTDEALAKPLPARTASEVNNTEDAVSEAIVPESNLIEDELSDEEAARPDEADMAVPSTVLDGPVQQASPEVAEASDWVDASALTTSDESSARPTVGEKPSLLEMPVILVGWVKDVLVSMTKPKPSKPTIEIPRRDPVVAARSLKDRAGDAVERSADSVAAAESAVISDSRYNDNSEDDNFEDDDWEESNWAD